MIAEKTSMLRTSYEWLLKSNINAKNKQMNICWNINAKNKQWMIADNQHQCWEQANESLLKRNINAKNKQMNEL